MKLLVCIKQVPDMESRFKPNSQGTWFAESDLAWRMNEYDEYAVEQAVQLREKLGEGTELPSFRLAPTAQSKPSKKPLPWGATTPSISRTTQPHQKPPGR